MTGIAQFLAKYDLNTLKEWSETGYNFIKQFDNELSEDLKIPQSIKTTSIKPSGTVSLLAGATPGVHLPHSRFYIRRVRLAKGSALEFTLKELGYHIEDDVMLKTGVVVSFPVDIGKGVKTLKDSNLWEQLSLAAFMQRHWADNQVSCTVSFRNNTEGYLIGSAIDFFQYQLKGISFLPLSEDKHPYPQMPYEEINEEEYQEMRSKIKSTSIRKPIGEHLTFENEGSKYCDNDSCSI
jgi:hypothetical protein